MKRLFTVIFIFISLFFGLYANAKTAPLYKDSINVEGIGIIRLPQEFTVYEKPSKKSKILKQYKWGDAQGAYSEEYVNDFIIFDPLNNIAFMSVVDDLESGYWYKVCYDQKNKLSGWVMPNDYDYYSWLSFFTKYGKQNGIYPFRDLDLTEKRLYSKDDLNSQILGSFEKAKDIRVQIFRGNWVLVRIYKYEGGMKIGWLKWRTDEGKFHYFPKVVK